MPGQLVLRVDAGAQIGVGHFMRCFTLAQAWQDEGGRVAFVMAEPPAACAERLQAEHMVLERIPGVAGSTADLSATRRIVHALDADWTVLDGYAFDAEYQRGLKGERRLLVIDDDGRAGRYDADLVLNQNRHARPDFYRDRSADTQLLLGLDYVLLRREFRDRAGSPRAYPREPNLLVTLGGSDPAGATEKILDAVVAAGITASTRIIVGPANPRAALLQQRADQVGIEVVHAPASLVPHMEWARLAISSGGATVWELLFMGTPLLVGTLVPVEALLVSAIADHPAVTPIGPFADLDTTALAALLRTHTGRADLPRVQHCGEWLVDGRGADRVITAMKERMHVLA